MPALTKSERKLTDKFKAMHRFRVAKTEEEKQAAVEYAQEYCERYKLNFKREFIQINKTNKQENI